MGSRLRNGRTEKLKNIISSKSTLATGNKPFVYSLLVLQLADWLSVFGLVTKKAPWRSPILANEGCFKEL